MFDEQMASGGGGGGRDAGTHVGVGWREIDRQVRRLARRRATLDAEEARLLIAARTAEVHRHLGYGSFDEYLERVLGYAPTTARDRMRVAVALEGLPETAAALAAGTVTFSAVREITRVATAETEAAWLDEIDGLTAREIEDSVRGHAPGDRPDDRPEPALEPRVVRLELAPETYALFLEARRALEKETGCPMTDSELMAAACRSVLDRGMPARANDGGHARHDDAEREGGTAAVANVPPHRIALTVCVHCKRGWQDAAGRTVEVSAAVIERMQCDAIELGRVDGAAPAATTRSIPAAVRRMVLARDHHRCQVPGCRSTRFVDVHHLRPRADGGDHRPLNLLTTCSLHHAEVHGGRIVIDGVPGSLRVTHADGRPYGASARATESAMSSGARSVSAPAVASVASASASSVGAEAMTALVTLGFRPPEARAAVANAIAHVGEGPLEAVLRAALRSCTRPAVQPPTEAVRT